MNLVAQLFLMFRSHLLRVYWFLVPPSANLIACLDGVWEHKRIVVGAECNPATIFTVGFTQR